MRNLVGARGRSMERSSSIKFPCSLCNGKFWRAYWLKPTEETIRRVFAFVPGVWVRATPHRLSCGNSRGLHCMLSVPNANGDHSQNGFRPPHYTTGVLQLAWGSSGDGAKWPGLRLIRLKSLSLARGPSRGPCPNFLSPARDNNICAIEKRR